MKQKIEDAPKLHCLEAIGPWSFITRCVYEKPDHSRTVWQSRHHRKGLLLRAAVEAEGFVGKLSPCLWMPRRLNWWIGTVFAAGSLLFALASVLSLVPALARAWSLDATAVNAIFFTGSIPFTIAAYLQLFQAANAGEFPSDETRSSRHPVIFGWRPRDIGFLVGSLLMLPEAISQGGNQPPPAQRVVADLS